MRRRRPAPLITPSVAPADLAANLAELLRLPGLVRELNVHVTDLQTQMEVLSNRPTPAAKSGAGSASIQETARQIGGGPAKVRELIALGELHSFMQGKRRRVVQASIDAYVARRVA